MNFLLENKSILLWINTLLLIIASTSRSWNMGYNKLSYALSGMCQIPIIIMAFFKKDKRSMFLNMFYLMNSMIAIYRWS
jgi:hypothetical protein